MLLDVVSAKFSHEVPSPLQGGDFTFNKGIFDDYQVLREFSFQRQRRIAGRKKSYPDCKEFSRALYKP
jgi:hypothetical protein